MNRSVLRVAIIVLTLATAGIHFTLLFPDPVFILNALGYLSLMVVFLNLVRLPFLAGREKLVWYGYMGFAAVTILAWLAIGDKSWPGGLLGYVTKGIEILLIAALWVHRENA